MIGIASHCGKHLDIFLFQMELRDLKVQVIVLHKKGFDTFE